MCLGDTDFDALSNTEFETHPDCAAKKGYMMSFYIAENERIRELFASRSGGVA